MTALYFPGQLITQFDCGEIHSAKPFALDWRHITFWNPTGRLGHWKPTYLTSILKRHPGHRWTMDRRFLPVSHFETFLMTLRQGLFGATFAGWKSMAHVGRAKQSGRMKFGLIHCSSLWKEAFVK